MIPYISARTAIVKDLHRHGCWPQYATADECLELLDEPTFKLGVTLFRNATGLVGDKTDVAEGNPLFFCALPSVAPVRGGICKWPQKEITFTTVGSLGNVSANDFADCAALTMGWWAEVCGITPIASTNSKTANIVMHAQRIDGPQGILAQMQLPCGANATSQMEGQFDLERLVISDNPPQGYLDLARIMCHELGHGLGSDHIGAGNLLAPTYDQRIRKPQRGDVAEMVKRYGPPLADVPPAPTPIPPASNEVVIRIRGELLSASGYRVLKV